jgi:hypothetical protein
MTLGASLTFEGMIQTMVRTKTGSREAPFNHFAKFVAILAVFILPPTVRAAGAQSTDADAACPGLKFEIRVPDDVVRPQSNLLLEFKLTNVTHKATWLSSDSSVFWSYEFELRDAQGALVPRTAEWIRAISQRPVDVTLNVNVTIPLAPNASLTD